MKKNYENWRRVLLSLILKADGCLVRRDTSHIVKRAKSPPKWENIRGGLEGHVTTDPSNPTSIANPCGSHGASPPEEMLVHEMTELVTLDEPNHDSPLTMLYLDGNCLALVYYCGVGNRPHTVGKNSPGERPLTSPFSTFPSAARMASTLCSHHRDKPSQGRLDLCHIRR